MNNDIEGITYTQDESEVGADLSDVTYKINSLEDANRYAYALSKTREEISEIIRLADIERAKWDEKIRQVDVWQDSLICPLEDKVDYLTDTLKNYHERVYEEANEKEKGKLKSIKLPYDITLKSKQSHVKIEVKPELEEEYKRYALANGYTEDLGVRVKWADFKKVLEVTDGGSVVNSDTGEVLDFLKFSSPPRSFEVK